jgi:hypothetical protein
MSDFLYNFISFRIHYTVVSSMTFLYLRPSPFFMQLQINTQNKQNFRHRNPQPLAGSATRLMYLRVYDSRDSSRQSAPSSSLYYSLTHAHRSIGYRNHNPHLLAESVARLIHLRVYDSRDNSHQSAPSPSLCYSLTHTHRSIGYRNRRLFIIVKSTLITLTPLLLCRLQLTLQVAFIMTSFVFYSCMLTVKHRL